MNSHDSWGDSLEVSHDSDTVPVLEWGQFPEPYLAPPPPPAVNAPIGEKERFASLDVLRGVSLLGILVVNIGAFALVRDARYVPHVSGDETGWNYLAWQITFFGADTKFIQIFTMLFGAGIAVMHDRSAGQVRRIYGPAVASILLLLAFVSRTRLAEGLHDSVLLHNIGRFVLGLPWTMAVLLLCFVFWDRIGFLKTHAGPWGRWLFRTSHFSRRILFLLVLGLAHTYLVWDGDILYDYAVWALLIYFALVLPWPVMVVIAVSLLSIEARHYVSNVVNRAVDYGEIELLVFRGGYLDQLQWRLERWEVDGKLIPFYFGFQAVGHMLLGVVAYRIGFFTGRWRTWIYTFLFVALAATGLYFIGEGTHWRAGFNWEEDALKFYWGSFALSLGYCAGLVCLAKAAPRLWITQGLAATGRMALTNYLMQTVICTTVFYGYGFGQFGEWPRFELLLFVVSVFTAQVVMSSIWLRYFTFGPMEWLWRSCTYLKLQPMRRTRAVSTE